MTSTCVLLRAGQSGAIGAKNFYDSVWRACDALANKAAMASASSVTR